MPVHSRSPLTLETHYGRLETDRTAFQPLDRVSLCITGRAEDDARCTIRVCDPLQRAYVEQEVELVNNQGEFLVSGGRGGGRSLHLPPSSQARHAGAAT